jgi:RNA recognition motif-containing protein
MTSRTTTVGSIAYLLTYLLTYLLASACSLLESGDYGNPQPPKIADSHPKIKINLSEIPKRKLQQYNEKAFELAKKLIEDMPTESILEITNELENYLYQRINEQELTLKLRKIFTLHYRYYGELFDFMSVPTPPYNDNYLQNSRMKHNDLRNALEDMFRCMVTHYLNPKVLSGEKLSSQMSMKYKFGPQQCLYIGMKATMTDISAYDSHDDEFKTRIFVNNLPDDMTKDLLIDSFGHMGEVDNAVIYDDTVRFNESNVDLAVHQPQEEEEEQLFEFESLDDEYDAQADAKLSELLEPTHSITATAVVASTASSAAAGGKKSFLTTAPASVLRVKRIGSAGFLKYKQVITNVRSDKYAFLEMTDSVEIRDDLRIFGLCIKNKTCKVKNASDMRTIIVELDVCLTAEDSRELLTLLLGENTNLSFFNTQDRDTKPVFIHLQFENHKLAWEAFHTLRHASQAGAPVKPSWIKTQWYWLCAQKELQNYYTSMVKDGDYLGSGRNKYLLKKKQTSPRKRKDQTEADADYAIEYPLVYDLK